MKCYVWKCPACETTFSIGENEDICDIRFDTCREVGAYVTFHHCGSWRKARISGEYEEAEQ